MSGFILASGSAIRRQILEGAGVTFTVEKSRVDEDKLKAASPGLDSLDLALSLAEAKALEVSARFPDQLVLGADQVMRLGGDSLDKAKTEDEAHERLIAMRGRPHELCSGLAAARGGEIVWRDSRISTLHVRNFSDAFLDRYMQTAGGELTASVGAYAYEGLGAQLFAKVDGDYYAILGLPLLPVLDLLRQEGALAP